MHPAFLALAMLQGTIPPPATRPAAPPATAPAAAPSLPPPARYQIDFKLTQEFDQAGGKGKVAGDITMTSFVTITMSDTAGGRVAHISMDSLSVAATGLAKTSVPDSMVRAAKGAYFHGYIVGGRIQGQLRASVPNNVALGLAQQTLAPLFPWIRPQAKAGDKWSDTLTMNNQSAAGVESGNTVTHWKVTAMDGSVYVLDETTELKTSLEKGGFLTRETTGASTQHIESPMLGPARTATVQETSNIQTIQPGTTTVIPGKKTSTISITKLP